MIYRIMIFLDQFASARTINKRAICVTNSERNNTCPEQVYDDAEVKPVALTSNSLVSDQIIIRHSLGLSAHVGPHYCSRYCDLSLSNYCPKVGTRKLG